MPCFYSTLGLTHSLNSAHQDIVRTVLASRHHVQGRRARPMKSADPVALVFVPLQGIQPSQPAQRASA